MNKILLIALLLLLYSLPAFSQTITGKVISIADGDTLIILNNRQR